MTSTQPDIIPSSPTGQLLQAAIQKQLVFNGWSPEDDTVMAEYCVVMLGNRKTPDQISTELSDLIGSDFDASFVSWLFTELSTHYPDPRPIPTTETSRRSPEVEGRRFSNDRGGAPAQRGGRVGVFGAAMSGVKRDSREMGGDGRDAQRQRYDRPAQNGQFEGVPAGPRGGQQGNQRGGRGQGQDGGQGGKSIFERVGGGRSGPSMNQNNNGFENPMAQFGGQQFNPAMLAQAQAQAMAQAQAFAAMQGQQINWTNGAGRGGFNGGAPAFNPAFGFQGGPPRHQQQFQQQQPRQAYAPVAPLPGKPTDETICQYGVDCKKQACKQSHPSPAATKASGLVLSSEACEKQLLCEDLDCSKSHVSVAQKNPAYAAAPSKSAAPSFRSNAPRAPPVADPSAIAGAGEKTCKFAASCTRPGCVFLHPWDVKGDAGSTSGVPCRWAEACTRADCHYSHPPNRPAPSVKGSKPKPPFTSSSAVKYSATFNKPSAIPSIGAWPTQEATHVSDRLKRFNGVEGETERIIPGETKAEGNKVEIDIEDDHKEREGAGAVEEKVEA